MSSKKDNNIIAGSNLVGLRYASCLIYENEQKAKEVIQCETIVGVVNKDGSGGVIILTEKLFDDYYPYNKDLVKLYHIHNPIVIFSEKTKLWSIGY